MERVVGYLQAAVPGSEEGPAALAVVAVDDVPTVALAVHELAAAKARRGARVVIADLSYHARAFRILGARHPGLNKVYVGDAHVFVVEPASGDLTTIGPLSANVSPEGGPDEMLVDVCAGADLVLSLVTLDPARDGNYLPTWAAEVVAVVTAGRSTAVRMHSVGEIVRLSGARLDSVVVVGADRSDESIGVTSAMV
jgi:hypothetical protein